MTHEEWIKLTPKEQQIKVAELCGWHDMATGYFLRGSEQIYKLLGNLEKQRTRMPVPDYLNDLNAMHGAEMSLKDKGTYMIMLEAVVGDTVCRNWRLTHATAAQRAEAFVMTMEGT
jgi:hypothetical protein